ncbi:6-phosphofructokinase 1 [Botrimarina colliarenosi]|uniref:ATP-dependent 6-phosphofructokinase n=1 Tax=Botrimarina colliarenosi TaxID=2528001 RepID=A0A5C6AAE9_9BACT|nr:ATP-dependent 6-phosphofructokinase [Botrimarina colliarenosi]TWT95303.1 6-phosphofructokinase 1 [Botrimarina colliarenosi]
MSKQRIGILTSGGDCPGLNAVIRGAVKASHQMGYDCVGFLKGYEGLYDPVQYVHLTPSSTRGILNQGGTILGSTNKGRFAATVGVQDRQEIEPHLIEGVKQTIEQLGITGLICVGGDGSLAVAQQFHEQGIPVVGVPKTIDNDLSATAFTFGFDSAIECATDALDRLHTTAASHERIMVLEVMGRHAGWIALHSGIAGGGDVILLPEIKWNWDHVCHKIMHRESLGKKFTLVVVAEGAHLPDGGMVGEQRNGQQMKLGGVGRAVTDEIERRLHRETRLSVLGHLQRGGKPTTFDRVLATQFGAHAVRLVHERRFGEMICSQPPDMNSVPIMEAVNVLRQVNPDGPAVQAARALGISFGDRPADEIGQNVFECRQPAAAICEEPASEEVTERAPTEPAPVEIAPVVASSAAAVEIAPQVTAEVDTDDSSEQLTNQAEPDTEEQSVLPEAAVTPAPVEQTETPVEESTTPAEELGEVEAEAGVTKEDELVAEVTADAEADAEDLVAAPSAVAEFKAEPTDAFEVTAETTAEASDEDAAAEEIAESVLEMVADADELIHGAVELPETDEADADTATDTIKEADATPSVLETDIEAVAAAALSLDPDDAASPAEEDQQAEPTNAETEPSAPAKQPEPDFSAAQAILAERIAAAAKAKRDEAPEDAVVEPAVSELSVADMVKQKLAAATAEMSKPAASPLDDPHGEDLVSEARSALEEALAE